MPDNVKVKGIDLDELQRIPMTAMERERLQAVWQDQTVRPILDRVYEHVRGLVLDTLLVCDKDSIDAARAQLRVVEVFFEVIGRSVKTEVELEQNANVLNPGLQRTI